MECQTCGEPLCVAGEESSREKLVAELPISRIHISPIRDIQSILGNSEMDQSFVILENQRKESPDKMDGSFVVLPPTVASVCGCDTSPEKGFVHIPSFDASSSDELHASNATFDSTATVFKHIFDIVSSQSQVQQPSCSECMKIMFEKIQREGEDIHRDIKAYEKCFETLKESPNVLSESDFLREKAKVEEEENKLEAQIKQIEKQRINVRNKLQEWESLLEHLAVMEERYWQNINSYSLELINHQEEGDAILAKEEVTQMQLDYLKRTNVLNDAFPIHADGDFGTINNLKLGVLPENPVQWDERNAAWGQACHLLHNMAMHCGFKFSYQIIPMGSYSCIADKNKMYKLYGPVPLFQRTNYDKAAMLFLKCLKEFGDYANANDRAANVPAETCFRFPYRIENNKVENLLITEGKFNRENHKTRALMYMVINLKHALRWFVSRIDF